MSKELEILPKEVKCFLSESLYAAMTNKKFEQPITVDFCNEIVNDMEKNMCLSGASFAIKHISEFVKKLLTNQK